jgi:transcription elongation factor GreB
MLRAVIKKAERTPTGEIDLALTRARELKMRKGFTRRPRDPRDPRDQPAAGAPRAHAAPARNYITPGGLQRLRDELRFLLTRERPAVTQVVAWAAGNGDRSENADYQYGKRRLREIDRRIRFLGRRIDAAELVDPEAPRRGRAATHVFFGATVRYSTSSGSERVIRIVGVDEVDLARQYVSWRSPLARAVMKAGPGDVVTLRAPGGIEELELLEVRYERIPVEPFTEPAGAEAARLVRWTQRH